MAKFIAITCPSNFGKSTLASILGLMLERFGLIIMPVASLGVMNPMIMPILQRTREIGVMSARRARRQTDQKNSNIEPTAIGFL